MPPEQVRRHSEQVGRHSEQVRRHSELVRRLRPLAKEVVDASPAAALDWRIGTELGEHLVRAGCAGGSAAC
ncbi:MAG TPA: hypothetical protein VGL49_03850 [Acidimicrobiales bacterium]